MNTNEIQSRIDTMPAAMSDKGLVQPSAEATIKANGTPNVYLHWGVYPDHKCKSFNGDDHKKNIDAAVAFIAALPSEEEAKLKDFMGALSDVIAKGRDAGIDVEFVNPLVETMKKLSSNALTDQRVTS